MKKKKEEIKQEEINTSDEKKSKNKKNKKIKEEVTVEAEKHSKSKKQERKENEKKINKIKGIDPDVKSKIFIILGIIAFLCIFYLITLIVTSDGSSSTSSSDDTTTETSISYEEIILGRSLSMSDGEYLVLCYDTTDEDNASSYSDLISTYEEKDDHLTIYYVDLSSPFNSSYTTTEESNKNPASASEMSINGPTLMKISSNSVVDYIEGYDDIANYLE
jgi:hypothetical protein